MTFYQAAVQYGIPTFQTDSGFYYCMMTWYFNAADSGEYDHAREGAIRITSEWLNVNVLIWDLFISEWPSAVVVEHSHPVWDHPVLSGPYGPLEMTVFASLRNDGQQVSYKRIRSPVRFEDCDDNWDLTDSALAYYQSVADLVGSYGCFTNANGIPITGAVVQRRVADWQLRHGTKRRNRRRTS